MTAAQDKAAAAEATADTAAAGASGTSTGKPGPCQKCAETVDRVERLETQLQAIGKLVVAAVCAGVAVYVMGRTRAALEAADTDAGQ